MNKLAEICAARAQRTGAGNRQLPERLPDLPARRDWAGALRARRGAIIAECKSASPSQGLIRGAYDPAALARTYQCGGADALSVLTEPQWFGGSDDHLRAVRAAVPLPVLRKDFMLDPLDLLESRLLGADAVLLIVAALGDKLPLMLAAAQRVGADALVEVHDAAELDRAVRAGAAIIGINNRDLRTLKIDLATTEKLAAQVPAGTLLISESGIETGADFARVRRAGARAALIGTALSRQPDAAAALTRLRRGSGVEVKICGVTQPAQAQAIAALGADYIGINFYAPSPRSVAAARGAEVAAAARAGGARTVGIFVDEDAGRVRDLADRCRLDFVQLHGSETPAYAAALALPYLKAFKVNAAFTAAQAQDYAGAAAWLFDAGSSALAGGTGQTFDWSRLAAVPRQRPLLLAGGITSDNAAAGVAAADPDVLDLASGVESAPGIKDMAKVAQLLRAVGR